MTVKTHNNTKGLVRAFDVRTGKLLWPFNTIPRPGEFGNDTWLNDSWAVNGNAGVWTQITVDEELGLVYLPVETPSSDYYGGHRPGNNLFAESLVCVDLKTGSASGTSSSCTIRSGITTCRRRRSCSTSTSTASRASWSRVPSKQSFLYVFDRVTGEPIWPIVETPVPQGDVPGEWYAPTQPIPTKPPAYARNWSRRSGRTDRLHAGDAGAGAGELEALQVGRTTARSTTRRSSATSTGCSGRSIWATRAAARTGRAPAPIQRPASSTRRRNLSALSPESVAPPPAGFSDIPYRPASWVSRSALREAPAPAPTPTCGSGSTGRTRRRRPRCRWPAAAVSRRAHLQCGRRAVAGEAAVRRDGGDRPRDAAR